MLLLGATVARGNELLGNNIAFLDQVMEGTGLPDAWQLSIAVEPSLTESVVLVVGIWGGTGGE